MTRHNRLSRLETAVGRAGLDNIPAADVLEYCDDCLGPRAHRRRLDAIRALMFAEGWDGSTDGSWHRPIADGKPCTHCRGCGGAAIDAAVSRVRHEAGLP